MADNDNWYHFRPPSGMEPPEHPSFDDIWVDRCAAIDLFEDIDVDPPHVVSALEENNTVSALSRDGTTILPPRDEAEFSRRKRLVMFALLAFVLVVGVLGTIVGVATQSKTPNGRSVSSNGDGNKLRGTALVKPTSLDNPVEVPGLEPLVESSETVPPPEDLTATTITTLPTAPCATGSRTDETPVESTNKTGSPVLPDTEPETTTEESEKACVPSITLRHKNLLAGIEPCDGCSSQVAMDQNVAVVKYGNGLYFHTEQDGELERSPTVYPVASSQDMQLALSKNFTVVSDSNGDVSVIDNKAEQKKGRKVRILDGGVERAPGFGQSIAIDGDLMAIGASGFAYLYRFKYGGWRLETQLSMDDYDDEPDDDFGEQVAVRGDKVAITGFNDEDKPSVFVYRKEPSSYKSWELIEEIELDDACDDCEDVGITLSFTDDNGSLMISYLRKNALYYSVLKEGEYVLDQEFSLPPDYYVDQAAVSGNTMVVGGSHDMLVFVKTEKMWTQVAKLTYTNEVSRNVESISLHGRHLMISSRNHALWYTLDGCISALE